MAWSNLPTDYTDAVWQGLKKYSQVDNSDGTVSFQDVTVYTGKEKSFFGARDANRMNEALNHIMGRLNGGTNLYEEFKAYFDSQKQAFRGKGDETYQALTEYFEGLKQQGRVSMDRYTEIQKAAFDAWFATVRDTLSGNAAGNLQAQITELKTVSQVTLRANGWTGDSAPYSQTVPLAGITANDNVTINSALADMALPDEQKSYNKAFSIITSGTGITEAGKLVFRVYRKPARDIVLNIRKV
jgi:hypothetical protein|nr:MAG TPA: hypothetical protein [Caudoviricetes sp.]